MYNNHCINHLSNYSLTAYPIVYTFIYDHCHKPFPFPFQSSIHLSLITDSYSYDALKFLAPPYLSFSFAMRLLNASKKNPKKLFHQNFSNTCQLGKKLLNFFVLLFYFVVTAENAYIGSKPFTASCSAMGQQCIQIINNIIFI